MYGTPIIVWENGKVVAKKPQGRPAPGPPVSALSHTPSGASIRNAVLQDRSHRALALQRDIERDKGVPVFGTTGNNPLVRVRGVWIF